MILLCRDRMYDMAGRYFLMVGWREMPVHEGHYRKFKLGFSVSFSLWPRPWRKRLVEVPPWAQRWFSDRVYVIPLTWRWPIYFTNLSAYARKHEDRMADMEEKLGKIRRMVKP